MTELATEPIVDAPMYMRDASLFELHAVPLVSLEEVSGAKHGTHKLHLQDTIFHPQGGGQPSDTGRVLSPSEQVVYTVLFVQANPAGGYDHYGSFFDKEGTICDLMAEFMAEDPQSAGVHLYIDAERRALHAKLHSAGHALDAAMLRLGHLSELQAAKGYHFTDGPYVEYNCSPGFTMSPEEMTALPATLNAVMSEMISEKIDTQVEFLSNTEAGELCQSDLSSYPAQVRVVTVAGNPCPCGGTHVANTEQLAGLEVTKAKIKKKVLKISYLFK